MDDYSIINGQSYDTSLIEINKKIRSFQLIGDIRPLSYREQFEYKYLILLKTKYSALKRTEIEKYFDKINSVEFN